MEQKLRLVTMMQLLGEAVRIWPGFSFSSVVFKSQRATMVRERENVGIRKRRNRSPALKKECFPLGSRRGSFLQSCCRMITCIALLIVRM
eukprot:3352879-Amphidinium_carterae.1